MQVPYAFVKTLGTYIGCFLIELGGNLLILMSFKWK